MSTLFKFDFKAQTVRVVTVDGKPWFVAKDLCDVLMIQNIRQNLAKLDDDERGSVKLDTPGGKQDVSVVSESGMYTLVMACRKPGTKPFRKWLTNTLATLRKSSEFVDFTECNPQYADTSGFVYLAKTPNGWYKIGMSKTPYKRMSSLQTGTPLEVTLVHRVFTFNMPALEKALHEYYSAYWMRGEWFDLPDDCVREFPLIANELDATLEQVSLPQS